MASALWEPSTLTARWSRVSLFQSCVVVPCFRLLFPDDIDVGICSYLSATRVFSLW